MTATAGGDRATWGELCHKVKERNQSENGFFFFFLKSLFFSNVQEIWRQAVQAWEEPCGVGDPGSFYLSALLQAASTPEVTLWPQTAPGVPVL